MTETMNKLADTKKDFNSAYKALWRNIGKKLADITGNEVKQKEYLINDILNHDDRIKSLEVKDRDLSLVDFSGKEIKNIKFINCNLNGANFSGAYLRDIEFENTKANNSNFNNASLVNCTLKNNCNLSHSNFEDAELLFVNFENSNVNNSNFTDSSLNGKIKNSSLNDTTFDGANITATEFVNSKFKGSSFSISFFKENQIDGCDFQDTIFGDSDIRFNKVTNSNFVDSTFFANVTEYSDDGYIENNERHDCSLEYEFADYDSNKLDKHDTIMIENSFERKYGDYDNEDAINEMNYRLSHRDREINESIDNLDFKNAYTMLRDKYAFPDKEFIDKEFIDSVIDRCGTDTNTIKNMVNSMVSCKEETQEYGAKLLSDVLNSNTYKEAKFKNESKTKEAVLA